MSKSPAARIVLHPFGRFPPLLTDAIVGVLQDRFRLKSAVGEALPYPDEAYSDRRGQFRSTEFLFDLDRRFAADRDFHIGITDVDLYVPELNFVFGEASPSGRAAVFSIARLRDEGENELPSEMRSRMLIWRAATEAVHEMGHLLGLRHCSRPDCVMWFSNTLQETDRKGSQFCVDHQRELAAKLKALIPMASPPTVSDEPSV